MKNLIIITGLLGVLYSTGINEKIEVIEISKKIFNSIQKQREMSNFSMSSNDINYINNYNNSIKKETDENYKKLYNFITLKSFKISINKMKKRIIDVK